MRRIFTAALAVSMILSGAAPALAKPHDKDRGRDDGARYEQGRHDNGNHNGERRRWARGERLPVTYYRDRGAYVDYRAHHLRAPPRGYQWVQVDNNYMMVALASGLIASIIANN